MKASFRIARLRPAQLVPAAMLAGFLLGTAAQAKTIKLGVVMPFSGLSAETPKAELMAMKLYYAQHKAELGGNDIEFIERDSKEPSGAGAQTAARELLAQEKVDMIAGLQYSPDAIASAQIGTQAKKPMLLVSAQTAYIPLLSPYFARFSASSWQPAYTLGGYAVQKLGCKTVATAYTDFPPGKDAVAAFRMAYEKAGGKVVDDVATGGAAQVPDYTPFMQRIRDEHPDCVFAFTPGGAFNVPLVRAYKDAGLAQAGIRFIGTADITQDSLLQDLGPDSAGLIVAGNYTADLDNPANKAFVAAWEKAGDGRRPDMFSVAAYDIMAAVFDVIKKTNGEFDGPKAMAVLAGWKHESPRGPIEIDPKTRDIIQNIYIMQVAAENGRIGMKVLDTVPAVKDPCKELEVGRCKSGS